MFHTIQLTKEKGIATAVISRPEALNALNKQVLIEIDEMIDQLQSDPEIRVLVITGDGRSFVAGADIASQSVLNVEEGRQWGEYGSKVFRKIEKSPIISLAAINGFALGGGCELAMCCDLRIASTKAKLGQPEVSLGITPGFSGTQRLAKLVGVAKAKELIFTGKMITGEEAEKIGLVNQVVEPENLMEKTYEMANQILKNAPLAVKYSKMAINRSLETHLDAGIESENDLFAMCYATKDQKEGMQAFLEKRNAVFLGK